MHLSFINTVLERTADSESLGHARTKSTSCAYELTALFCRPALHWELRKYSALHSSTPVMLCQTIHTCSLSSARMLATISDNELSGLSSHEIKQIAKLHEIWFGRYRWIGEDFEINELFLVKPRQTIRGTSSQRRGRCLDFRKGEFRAELGEKRKWSGT
jgi:hypothetical protein